MDMKLFEEMVEAFKVYRKACKDFEEESGVGVCETAWIQLNENVKNSPFTVPVMCGVEVEDHGPNGEKYHGYGFIYDEVDINWLVEDCDG